MLAGHSQLELVGVRRVLDRYQRPLIVMDRDNAADLAPILERLDSSARIVLLGVYRIPFHGSRLLLGAPRLERELEMCRRERMEAFVRSSGLDGSRFELVTQRGDARDHVHRELRSRRSDLVVLAFDLGSPVVRLHVDGLASRLLDETTCDVMVVGRSSTRDSHDARAALGPMKLTCSIPPGNRPQRIARLMLVLGAVGTSAELTDQSDVPRLVLFLLSFAIGLVGLARVGRRSQHEPTFTQHDPAHRWPAVDRAQVRPGIFEGHGETGPMLCQENTRD
jgi:nucleotide-binding universal stress UspA family protein